jgi:hypothetical protein
MFRQQKREIGERSWSNKNASDVLQSAAANGISCRRPQRAKTRAGVNIQEQVQAQSEKRMLPRFEKAALSGLKWETKTNAKVCEVAK